MLRYGLNWSQETNPLLIEFKMIQNGGFITVKGKRHGEGLPYHYEAVRKLLWPNLDDHRWHRVCRDTILTNKVTVLMGCASSGKTHEAAWIYLVEYFCWPDETCVLVSSTDIRGLRMRVWGEITMLWQAAIERFDFLPGHLLESRIAITTDAMQDSDYADRTVRDMRKGIIGIPTVQSGKFIGLGKWAGIKQKRLRLIADEAAMMGNSFLSAFANLNKNEDFRAIVIGNPNDPLDPLGKTAEPLDGWSAHLEPEKTEVWKTRFMNGSCVNLIGTDSPNFDFPENEPTRYKYLISREKIADTLSFFPKNSSEYYSQCVGCMKVGTLDDRIITRDLCRNFGAMDDVIWSGEEPVKVAALDSAYGGDRAVCGHIEFGKTVEGQTVIAFNAPQIVPITVNSTTSPEEQLATWIREYCERKEIPPANFFHDSTGRGGLGTAIARAWSADCNPIEFGGSATDRPVAIGLYVFDVDTQTKRLAKCSEHYDRLVSELWYQFRYAIESRQLRRLPEDVMDELCMRKWERKKNNRISVETKEKMKERIGRSPDLGDWACLCLEGARRLGFVIEKLPGQSGQGGDDSDYLERELDRYRRGLKKRSLHYSNS
jgi:hypothetical protein